MLRPTLPDRGQPAQRLLVQRLPDLAGLLHVLGHQQMTHQDRDLKETYCYETIMFGRVTHTLDAAAMRVRSFVYVFHIL